MGQTVQEKTEADSKGRALAALVQGSTIERAAQIAGVCERTVYRWCKEPAFKDELRRARYEAMSNALSLTVRSAPAAVNALLRVMTDSSMSAQARVTAATSLLRFGQDLLCTEAINERMDELEKAQDDLNSITAMKVADEKSMNKFLQTMKDKS